ncbi:hypothetical protein ES288_A01G171800v1 [Gossypium darwinii]|uniref:Uncharacterized protein n=1 Tax=Gossypium darwinii TaxID=34276 RepID=A0A5D2HMI2_GOSDA|nr:hypothetical protein ES288_A01G171800v1 [Gossypium darwinii]
MVESTFILTTPHRFLPSTSIRFNRNHRFLARVLNPEVIAKCQGSILDRDRILLFTSKVYATIKLISHQPTIKPTTD